MLFRSQTPLPAKLHCMHAAAAGVRDKYDQSHPKKTATQASEYDQEVTQLPRLKEVKLTSPNDMEWLDIKKQFARKNDMYKPDSM